MIVFLTIKPYDPPKLQIQILKTSNFGCNKIGDMFYKSSAKLWRKLFPELVHERYSEGEEITPF